MINKSHSDIFKIFSLISSLIVFIYLIIRAINIPIVHDEAATFFYYIQSGNFIPYYAHWDANNHILNSALSFVNYSIFGDSVLSLRLANLLSFPIFAFFVYKISTKLSYKTYQYLLFISLIFTHNFIEYFAFSRGYGLSMALIMGAIYFLFKFYNSNSFKNILLTLLFVNLAVLSNLTLINSAILISSLLIINVFVNRRKTHITLSLKKYLSIIILGVVPIVLFSKLLFDFKNHNLLYYGTHEGFWNLSVQSLVKLLADNNSFIIDGIIIFVFSIISILSTYIIYKSNFKDIIINSKFIFPVLLFGSLMAVLLLDSILNINYPEDRTGLYFYPFFIASFIFVIDDFLKHYKFNALRFSPIIVLIIPLHFLMNMNISHSSFWQTEGIPERFITTVKEENKSFDHNATIGGSHIRVLCWAYYNYINGGELNQLQYSEFPEHYSYYQISDDFEFPNWEKYYKKIDYDPISQINLLERKHFDAITPIYSSQKSDRNITSKEFIGIGNYENDNVKFESLNIDFELNIKSKTIPLNARVVLSVQNANKQTIQYDYISINWKKNVWDENSKYFKGSFNVNHNSDESKYIKVYIWNNNKVEIETSEIQFNINTITK